EVADLYFDVRRVRQVIIDAGAELNQADAIAAREVIGDLDERDDAAGNDTSDEFHADFFVLRVGGLDADVDVFVARGTFSLHGVEELPLRFFQVNHLAADWRVLHMHI